MSSVKIDIQAEKVSLNHLKCFELKINYMEDENKKLKT